MRALLMLSVLSIAIPARELQELKKPIPTFHQQLLGEWQLVKVDFAGGPGMDAVGRQEVVMVFDQDVIYSREKNGRIRPEQNITYTLDTTRTPIAIDLVHKDGPTERMMGIVKIDGEMLTICFAPGLKGGRPTAFTSELDSNDLVMHLKRIKK